MSDTNSSQKKLIIAGTIGAVLIGGAAAYWMLRGQDDEEDDDMPVKKPSKRTARKVPTADADAEETPSLGSVGKSDTMICNEYSFAPSDVVVDDDDEGTKDAADPSAAPTAAPAMNVAHRPGQPDANGVIKYDHLGFQMTLKSGWEVNEDVSPMPNVMVIGMGRPDWANKPQNIPGAVPIVLLSIEDITHENLNLTEFKDKSKNMAITQMMMMTNGMIQPNVTFDGPLHVGVFSHCLEYEQSAPGFKLQVLNLLAEKNGLAYVFQVMCNPAEFTAVRSDVIAMAKTVVISESGPEMPYDQQSFVEVAGPSGTIHIPSPWQCTSTRKKAGLASFELKNASTMKPELIAFHTAEESAAKALKGLEEVSSTTIEGVVISNRKEHGKNERKVATYQGNTVIVSPLSTKEIFTSNSYLVTLIKSFDGSKTAPETDVTYNNIRLGYSHKMAIAGRILESKVSERTVVYVPAGMTQDQDGPVMTVRVGDPSNDPDCRPTLDEWARRIENEQPQQQGISNVKRGTVVGRDCVTFENREMVETGPGTKEERMAKVYIFLKDIRTTMFRWECPSNQWRRQEATLNKILNSVEIF